MTMRTSQSNTYDDAVRSIGKVVYRCSACGTTHEMTFYKMPHPVRVAGYLYDFVGLCVGRRADGMALPVYMTSALGSDWFGSHEEEDDEGAGDQ